LRRKNIMYEMQKPRDKVKIGGSTSKIDIVHMKMCAEKLGMTRSIKGKQYHLYAAGTSEWADHLAKRLNSGRTEKGVNAISVRFADPALFYKAVYVRLTGRS